jgi:formylglycine-generating enzyme required for sulfatase activity
MGRGTSGSDAYTDQWVGADEQPEHEATVDGFMLDVFEVTVGRFRKFVEAYDGTPPPEGAGVHPAISGSGWQSAWDAALPATRGDLVAAVKCHSTHQTYSETSGDARPMNCVSWYVAFAFCAWDGSRLPTEAEIERAAEGGLNRLFPWGDTPPTATHANFGPTPGSPFIAVGSFPDGAGRWEHHDLAGSMWEWALDWYDASFYGASCDRCANLLPGSTRVARCGAWDVGATSLRSANRFDSAPNTPKSYIGFRCARTP